MANMVYWRSSRSLYRSLSLKCTGCRPLVPMIRTCHDDFGKNDDFMNRMRQRLIKKECPLSGDKNTKTVGATGKTNTHLESAALSKLSISNEINSLSNVIASKENCNVIKNAKSSSTENKSGNYTKDKGCLSDDELHPSAMIIATRVKAFVASAEIKELICKRKLDQRLQTNKVADTKPSKISSPTKIPTTPAVNVLIESSNTTASANATGSRQVGAKPGVSRTTTKIKTLGDKLKDKVNKAIANNANIKTSPMSMKQTKTKSSQHGFNPVKSNSTKDKVNKSDTTINANKKPSEALKDKSTFQTTASGDKANDKLSSVTTVSANKNAIQVSNTQSKKDSSKDGATPVKSKSTSDIKTVGATPGYKIIKLGAPYNANNKSSEKNASSKTTKDKMKVPNTQSKKDSCKDGSKPVKSRCTSDLKTVGDATKDKTNKSDTSVNANTKIISDTKTLASGHKSNEKIKSFPTNINTSAKSSQTSRTQSQRDVSRDGAKPVNSKTTVDIKIPDKKIRNKEDKSDKSLNINIKTTEASKAKNTTETSSESKSTTEFERAKIAVEGTTNPERFLSQNEEKLSKAKSFQKLLEKKYPVSDYNKVSKHKKGSTASATNKILENNTSFDQKCAKERDVPSQNATNSAKTKSNEAFNDTSNSSKDKTSSNTKGSQIKDSIVPNDNARKNLTVKGCIPNPKIQMKPNLYDKNFNVIYDPKNNRLKSSIDDACPKKSLSNAEKWVSGGTIEPKAIELVSTDGVKQDSSSRTDGIKSDCKRRNSVLYSRSHGMIIKCAQTGKAKKRGSIASLIENESNTHLGCEVNLPESKGQFGVKKSSEDGERNADFFKFSLALSKSNDKSSKVQTENSNSNVGSKGSSQRIACSKEKKTTVAQIVSDVSSQESQKSVGQNDVVADCHTSLSRKGQTVRSYGKTEFVESDVTQIDNEFVMKEYQKPARNKSGCEGEKKTKRCKHVKAKPAKYPMPQTRKPSLTQFLYDLITGRGDGSNESGRKGITTYCAVSGRKTDSDDWPVDRDKSSNFSRRKSRRNPQGPQKNDVYISPDITKRGLGAENIQRERRSKSQDNKTAEGDEESH